MDYMNSTTADNKQNTRAPVRATDEQRDILLLSFKTSRSPSKAELALLSFQTDLDMDWISRWFMRQRKNEKRRTALSKRPKSAADRSDLAVKRELVDAPAALNVASASGTRRTKVPRAKEEDASSTHIPSSPTRYSEASSLPPSSSPPSSPPPAHTVKSLPLAPYREAATKPTARILKCVPYEDPRARPPKAVDAHASPELPVSAPGSAYMHHLSRQQHPSGSPAAAGSMSATPSTGHPAASSHDGIIAPKPTRPLVRNPYLPGGPTLPALLPVSCELPPSDWQQYLSGQASSAPQVCLGDTKGTGAMHGLDALAAAAANSATEAEVSKTPSAAQQEISPKTQAIVHLLVKLERETDVAKIALLLAKLRRLGLQW